MSKRTIENDKTLKNFVDNTFYKDAVTAIRSNGKSKSVEDFNILENYFTSFDETPSLVKITHDECDLFLYDKFKTFIKKEFPDSYVVFKDSDYNLKRDKYISNREVWYISDGYLLNLWTSESKNLYANPELDVKLDKYDELIESNTLLTPPLGSKKHNKDVEVRLINTFKKTTIKEYYRNSIGMISVDGTGELYVKEFSIDKKFKIQNLDLHYGDDFKNFHEQLIKKLKKDTKGLVLLHGVPGTGKCVVGETKITVKDKTTGEIKTISISELMNDTEFIIHYNKSRKFKSNKFIESNIIDKYEVLSDGGWIGVESIHKTIEYDEWLLKTETGLKLVCADFHIVFDKNEIEVFVKDLKKGDLIKTKDGVDRVSSIENTYKKSNMYDLELDDGSDRRYYTNGILSHNTYYLRYLLQRLSNSDKKVLYFPPSMVSAITDPSFFNFITNWTMDNGKNSILLIEDAEPLLVSREENRNMGITNLLNLTDGILNDILSIQIIATFNTNLNELDDALLRPERLIARKEFTKLDKKNCRQLAEKLGVNPELITEDKTLAEIYSIKNNNEILTHGISKSGGRKKIGFGS